MEHLLKIGGINRVIKFLAEDLGIDMYRLKVEMVKEKYDKFGFQELYNTSSSPKSITITIICKDFSPGDRSSNYRLQSMGDYCWYNYSSFNEACARKI